MNYTLTAEPRAIKGKKLRYEGKLPVVVYGADKAADSLAVSPVEFLKLYKLAGESSLIDLVIAGKEVGKVLVQDVQFDPVSDRIIHADLRRIDMNKAMTAPVVLRFTGEAPVVKASGGTMVTNVNTVIVECLPKDLVSHIDVDLSPLTSYEVVIKIKDIKLPAGIKIASPAADALVAKAAPALTEEEIKAMEASSSANADLSKIESAKKEKVEEAVEGAEGADKAAAPAADAKKEEKKEVKK